MTVSQFFPDADPESSTVDGETSRNVSGTPEDWAVIVAGAGNGSIDASTTTDVFAQSAASSGKWGQLIRSAFLFNTSSLTGSTILSATLNLRVFATYPDIAVSLVPVAVNPSSNTGLAGGDHTSYGSTPFATPVAVGSLAAVGSFQSFPLNAAGLDAINLTGISKFGLILEEDRTGVSPTWSSLLTAGASFYTADAGGSSRPYLEVTYTPPASAALSPSYQGQQIRRRFYPVGY